MISINQPLDLNDPAAEPFLSNLQGNILKGHGRSHTSLLFLRFKPDQPSTYGEANSSTSDVYGGARAALARFAKDCVTTAWEQQLVSQNRNTLRRAGNLVLLAANEQLFAMVLLSAKGYAVLLTDANDRLTDGAFQQGMRGNSEVGLLAYQLVNQWEQPYQGDVHAMILLAHEDAGSLQTHENTIRKATEEFFDIFYIEHGDKLTLPDKPQQIEHFGYADGLSNPILIKQDIDMDIAPFRNPLKWNSAANLDIALVAEPRQHGGETTYGSYMVFYKLEQNVPLFRERYQAIGDQIIGRAMDGTPLIPSEESGINNFDYAGDPDGARCPATAHIRKMNDRTTTAPRIVRRGIAYGTRRDLLEGSGDPPRDGVGLLFMSFQSDITQTFEALQQHAVDPAVPDALIGTIGGGDTLVTPRGGEYFFAPSLPFLLELATLREEQIAKFSKAWATLLSNDTLFKEFGKKWKRSPLDAAHLIGIDPNDFATLYASYLKASPENMKKIKQGRFILGQGAIHIARPLEKEKLRQALNLLLDPAILEQFIALWSNNPTGALVTIGLEREDMLDFYAHLRAQKVELEWPLWL